MPRCWCLPLVHKDTGTETISRPHSRKLLAESSLPLISRFPQGAFGQLFFDVLKPRREGLHSRHALVHAVARVKTAQRSVRKIPFPGIEAKALVNHLRLGNKVNS